jgi:hypothetical protein
MNEHCVLWLVAGGWWLVAGGWWLVAAWLLGLLWCFCVSVVSVVN